MKLLYQKIVERLGLVDELKYIHLFNNQFENPETENAIPLPCGLIDLALEDVRWVQTNNRTQYGEIIFTIHLAFENYTYDPIEIFELETKVYKVLQTFHYQDIIYPFTRIATRTNKNYSNIYVLEIDYQTTFVDKSAQPDLVQATLTLDTSVSVEDSTSGL